MAAQNFASGIYHGWVRHRRLEPRKHAFQYKVFMMYLDLDELDEVLALSPFWSAKRWALARFKRDDYFGGSHDDLRSAVHSLVHQELGVVLDGPVRMLTNLRYFGFIINPITIYYCYDRQEQLQAMVLEVTNTPWGKSHRYALRCDPAKNKQRISFQKAMHVSPFHPMNMEYRLNSINPGENNTVHLENWTLSNNARRVFDATLALQRQEITSRALNKVLFAYPVMTMKVFWGIYWQALKLFLKKVPVFSYGELSEQKT